MSINKILEQLIVAADNHNHGEDDPDHTVGDLEGLLRRAWSIMTVSQKKELLQSDEVDDLAMLGARGEFEQEDLLEDLGNEAVRMEREINAAGYRINETEGGFYWETDDVVIVDWHWYARADAVAAAYADMTEPK